MKNQDNDKMCLYPRLIKNRKYIPNKKNGGKIPPLPKTMINGVLQEDKRVLVVAVGCQKCIECMKKKTREWQVRLAEEVKYRKNAIFVTLTFSNESIKELIKDCKSEGYDRDNEIASIAVRRFLERWRKKHKKSVRHWLVTELGQKGTENIHLHGIIWTEKGGEEINNIWKYGFTWCSDQKGGWVNEQTVNYIVKYINKVDIKHKYYKPKIYASKGIGKDYVKSSEARRNQYNNEKTEANYKTKKGHKTALPIYYRNKIYTDEEREMLWLQLLDKNERWVCGVKIDVSKGNENYLKTLKYYRSKNKRLGYGSDEKNWQLEEYEKQRRNFLYNKRTNIGYDNTKSENTVHNNAISNYINNINLRDIW